MSYPKQFEFEIRQARDAICALLDTEFLMESSPTMTVDLIRSRGVLDTLLDRCVR